MNMREEPPIDLDAYRKNFLKYTARAFRALPRMEKPRILDIGCGSGLPAMELARLSNGDITGIDIDQSALDRMDARIRSARLSRRVRTIHRSLTGMAFPEESFDVIWAEGSVFVLGFEKCLAEWRRFIKPAGFLVVHDALGDIARKLRSIPLHGYKLVKHFMVSGETWWRHYYRPLQARVSRLREKKTCSARDLDFLDQQQSEIDTFNKDRRSNGSVFIIMQKSACPDDRS
jgi:SAM-dependent methyltransferase